jgi:hypothetical protein
MRNHSVVPSPWWQVGLPGLMLWSLGRASLPDPLGNGLRLLVLAVAIALGALSIVPAVMQRSLLNVQAWGMLSLGTLAGIAAMLGLFATTGTLDLYLVCFLLLVVAGLVYARRYRGGAGLFVLEGGFLIASIYIEPGMYLVNSPVASTLVSEAALGLFWVLTPIVVLRSRSVLGQALGLLLPMAAYAVAFVFTLSSISGLTQPMFQFSISQAISIASPYIALFATVALAVLIYEFAFHLYGQKAQ